MTALHVFADNLKALMRASVDFSSNYKVSVASGVAATSVRRFMLEEAAAQIDSVEKVAHIFDIRACDILDPDLTRRLQTGEPLRMGEPKPPVMAEDDWKALSPRARALVEELCSAALGGQISDEDITWLHNSLQRITKPASTPPLLANATPSAGAAPKFMANVNAGGTSHQADTINNGDVHFGAPPPRTRRK